MMKWELKRFDESDMPPDLDADIKAGLCAVMPNGREYFSKQRGWNGVMPEFTLVAQGDDRLLGHVSVVKRTIRVGKNELVAGGVQNVFVVPEMKGSGLSGDMIRSAVAEMARRDYDCGLLFCLPELEKVYAPMGWRHIGGDRKILLRQDGKHAPIPEKNIAMFFPVKTLALPEGDIDLMGRDW